jgi:hypothetical protein
VIAFGIAVAYRLHRPRTYEDIYGKAYRQREEDEYSQLFRKLTEEDLRGSPPEEDAIDDGGPPPGEAEEEEEEHEGQDGEADEEEPPD